MTSFRTIWRDCCARVSFSKSDSRRRFISGRRNRNSKQPRIQFEVLEPRAMLSATMISATELAPADSALVQLHDAQSGFDNADAIPIERANGGQEKYDPIFALPGPVEFIGESGDYLVYPHSDALEIPEGTVSIKFTADDVSGQNALFSKDASGTEVGGHLTAFVVNDRLKVRFQSTTESIWLETQPGSIEAGQEYHLAITFGDEGFWIYLDGVMTDGRITYTDRREETKSFDVKDGLGVKMLMSNGVLKVA